MLMDDAAHRPADLPVQSNASRRQSIRTVHPAQAGVERLCQLRGYPTARIVEFCQIEVDTETRAACAAEHAGGNRRDLRKHDRRIICRRNGAHKKRAGESGSCVPSVAAPRRWNQWRIAVLTTENAHEETPRQDLVARHVPAPKIRSLSTECTGLDGEPCAPAVCDRRQPADQPRQAARSGRPIMFIRWRAMDATVKKVPRQSAADSLDSAR